MAPASRADPGAPAKAAKPEDEGREAPGGRDVTLQDFVRMAIQRGFSGRRLKLDLEQARHTRDATLLQSQAPALSANASAGRAEVETNRSVAQTDEGETSLSISQPLPTATQLNVTGKLSSTRTKTPTSSQHDLLDPGWSATLAQPVFLFIRNPVLRGRLRARLGYETAEDAHRSTRLGLEAQARSLYYDVLLRRESLEVERRKLKSSTTLLDITNELVRAGSLARVETMRSRVRIGRDRRQFKQAVAGLEKAKQSALSFVNLPPGTPVVFSSRLAFEPFAVEQEALARFARANRPELRRLRRARELARMDREDAAEALRPNFDLSARYGSNETSSRVDDLARNRTLARDWKLGGALTWRFYDFGISRHRTILAELGEQAAEVSLAETTRTTELEVQNAYLDVKTIEEQLLEFGELRAAARENVEILRIQFQNGTSRIIDVFDAENEARSTDLEYLNLLVSFYTAQDRLAQLIGTDLDSL
ncbi:MAG: TolC family protein [Elusimicrobia bacterium]|nr:TolC family protein [Elusimicrobiota bacterium]